MSLHYVLDGYNILRHLPPISEKKIKNDRAGLILLLKTNKRLQKQKVTLVFDGYGDISQVDRRIDFKVLFSEKISADRKIKNLIEYFSNTRQIVVVSDDNEIRFFVRSLGARVLSVTDFLNWILNKDRPQDVANRRESTLKDLNYKDIVKINRELRKIWLKE